MTRLERTALFVIAISLAACSRGELTIASVSPAEGSARGGETVTIEGHGFGEKPKVRFGGEAAEVTSATEAKIEVVVPRGIAGAVDVEVEVNGERARRAEGFTYLPLPFTFVDAAWSRVAPLAVNGAGVAIADADGDGDADVFQAARGEGVWVYENDGKGSLGKTRLIRVEGDPADVRFVLARDLDDDGNVDLFLGTTGKTQSRILLGDGTLGFDAAPDALPTLFGTDESAAAVDLDGDGDLDLVITGAATTDDGAPGVVILSGKGDGTFANATAKRLAGGSFAASGVAVGDVDGDGDLDLFFAGDEEPCRLYLNDGRGALQLAAPDAIPYDPAPGAGIPALGDIDGDGSLDIYLPAAGQDRIFLNDGTGRFTDMTDVLLGPESSAGRSAVIADLDLDGHADVAVLEDGLRLYRNDGTGRLFDYSGEVAVPGAGLAGAGLALGDIDGDGDDDIFVSRGDFARAALFSSWSPLTVADADADGVPNLADNCPKVANPDQANLDSLPFRCASGSQCAKETGCDLAVFQKSAYLVCRDASVTWAEASAACAARGGSLVTISNADENAFVLALGAGEAWIGYSDAETEGTFVWAAGGGSYINWGMSQPDDAGGAEDCAEMVADGTWNDLPCDAKRAYVCEDLRSRAPDPGDACDACPTSYEPDSEPVDADAGVCGGAGGGMP